MTAIVETLQLPQPVVSRHLARLRRSHLVEATRKGKRRLYRLADRQSRAEQALLAALEPFVAATPEAQDDLRRAETRLPDRPARQNDESRQLTVTSKYATKWLLERRRGAMPERGWNDAVFRALSNRTRRELLDRIQSDPGATLVEIGSSLDGSRQAVRKHVEVLVEANLVHVMEAGRTRRLYYNAVPLQELYDRWTDERTGVLARQILAVRDAVEAMEDGDE